MNIAILGLGIIGSRAAECYKADPQLELTVWNRTPTGSESEANSIEAAVTDADVVALYLKDSAAVRAVVSEMAEHVTQSIVLLNHSTVDLETTQWLAALCEARGWGFLDAPFTGSREAAAAGKLVYYTAGPDTLIDRMEPLLLQSGQKVIRMGDIGNATIVKLVTNLVSACTVQALSEGLATAIKHGIDPSTFTEAIASNACGSPLAAMKLPTIAEGDFDAHFSLENMLKDSRYALLLANGLETPAIEAVSSRMAELCEAGLGKQDYSALAKPYLQQ